MSEFLRGPSLCIGLFYLKSYLCSRNCCKEKMVWVLFYIFRLIMMYGVSFAFLLKGIFFIVLYHFLWNLISIFFGALKILFRKQGILRRLQIILRTTSMSRSHAFFGCESDLILSLLLVFPSMILLDCIYKLYYNFCSLIWAN